MISNHNATCARAVCERPSLLDFAGYQLKDEILLLESTDIKAEATFGYSAKSIYRPAILELDKEVIYQVQDRKAYVYRSDRRLHASLPVERNLCALEKLKHQGLIPECFQPRTQYLDRGSEPRPRPNPHIFMALQNSNETNRINLVFARARSLVGAPLNGAVTDLTVLTGPCLFGAFGMQALIAGDGVLKPYSIVNPLAPLPSGEIAELSVQTDFSLYEVEFIERVVGLVGNLVKEAPSANKLCVHVPREEYVTYLLPKLLAGEVNRALFCEYVQHVFDRSAKMRRAILAKIDQQCRGQSPEIEFIQPLSQVQSLLCDPPKNTVSELLARLTAELATQELFGALLRIVPPKTFQEIANMSYTSGYIAAGTCEAIDRHAALVVQNYPEEYTFSVLTEKLRTKLKAQFAFRIAGIYTHERCLVPQPESDLNQTVFTNPYFGNVFLDDEESNGFRELVFPRIA